MTRTPPHNRQHPTNSTKCTPTKCAKAVVLHENLHLLFSKICQRSPFKKIEPLTLWRNYNTVKAHGGDCYYDGRLGKSGQKPAFSEDQLKEAEERLESGEFPLSLVHNTPARAIFDLSQLPLSDLIRGCVVLIAASNDLKGLGIATKDSCKRDRADAACFFLPSLLLSHSPAGAHAFFQPAEPLTRADATQQQRLLQRNVLQVLRFRVVNFKHFIMSFCRLPRRPCCQLQALHHELLPTPQPPSRGLRTHQTHLNLFHRLVTAVSRPENTSLVSTSIIVTLTGTSHYARLLD
ncbi:hypothetical protein GGX14DRAFT_580938 [Mycena pura]|uniref:Uncharacterized protein n=1 Tax=Mycena pura TaxID=153505 RepID=A0AAD6ULP7_9AGAR|nr:hypothetical protein GGX14DRAFT_580938 [Mycena pura]